MAGGGITTPEDAMARGTVANSDCLPEDEGRRKKEKRDVTVRRYS